MRSRTPSGLSLQGIKQAFSVFEYIVLPNDRSRNVSCSRFVTGAPAVHARADSTEVHQCPRHGTAASSLVLLRDRAGCNDFAWKRIASNHDVPQDTTPSRIATRTWKTLRYSAPCRTSLRRAAPRAFPRLASRNPSGGFATSPRSRFQDDAGFGRVHKGFLCARDLGHSARRASGHVP